jgi:hypothetical protein
VTVLQDAQTHLDLLNRPIKDSIGLMNVTDRLIKQGARGLVKRLHRSLFSSIEQSL